jgi:hypothetical protein
VAAFFAGRGEDAKSMICFETDDFQIDPNQLKINEIKEDGLDYNFIQTAEVFPRDKKDIEFDPISSVQYIVED